MSHEYQPSLRVLLIITTASTTLPCRSFDCLLKLPNSPVTALRSEPTLRAQSHPANWVDGRSGCWKVCVRPGIASSSLLLKRFAAAVSICPIASTNRRPSVEFNLPNRSMTPVAASMPHREWRGFQALAAPTPHTRFRVCSDSGQICGSTARGLNMPAPWAHARRRARSLPPAQNLERRLPR